MGVSHSHPPREHLMGNRWALARCNFDLEELPWRGWIQRLRDVAAPDLSDSAVTPNLSKETPSVSFTDSWPTIYRSSKMPFNSVAFHNVSQTSSIFTDRFRFLLFWTHHSTSVSAPQRCSTAYYRTPRLGCHTCAWAKLSPKVLSASEE